jgi:hypothetical protein
MPYKDQGSPWSSNTSVKTRDVPFHNTEFDLSLCLESGEEPSDLDDKEWFKQKAWRTFENTQEKIWTMHLDEKVPDHDMEGVYSICFTNYPAALREALEKNPSFRRCEVQSRKAGHVRDLHPGTDVICNGDQLQAILIGLSSCRQENHVIVTETYRYWIFELLRHLRSFHVGLNETFLFSVPQSDLSRVQSARGGQRLK